MSVFWKPLTGVLLVNSFRPKPLNLIVTAERRCECKGEWSTSFLILQKNGIPSLGVNHDRSFFFLFFCFSLFSDFLSRVVLYFEKKVKSHMEEEEASLGDCYQFYRLFQKCFIIFLSAQGSAPLKSLNPSSFCPLIPKVTIYTLLCHENTVMNR